MEQFCLQGFSLNEQKPIIGNFELTRHCNLNCSICCNQVKDRQEMSFDEILKFIDKMRLYTFGLIYINFKCIRI